MEKNEIHADGKTVREVLDQVKYTIDFFQREYKWGRKHIDQLLDDLTTKFLSNYNTVHKRKEVLNYGHYFLGPIILSVKKDGRSIIDRQQRLTSITLLLIYLNNLQKSGEDKVPLLNNLIFSEKYGEKSFNLQIEDRKECMEALYNDKEYDASDKDESVKNIIERYKDIQELFSDELKDRALPYFIDWLRENVIFVEIETYSDEDAYTIFETMNDRGLNLTSTEMLKGYILSNIRDIGQKHKLNELWRQRILEMNKISKDKDLEFFRAWLRAKYAETLRPGRKGAANEDFEKIGTRFHNWVRDNKQKIGLKSNQDFLDFVTKFFDFYVKLYIKIDDAAVNLQKGLENIYYINGRGLASSIYFPLLMSPIKLEDDNETVKKKLSLVSKFLEMFVVFRAVNYRNYAHSSIRYTMYTLVKEIRDKNVKELAQILKNKALAFEVNLNGFKDLRLHGQNRRFIHFLLARITTYIENKCGVVSNFEDYVKGNIKNPFQVEHIWSDKFEEHNDEFEQRDKFEEYRNRAGALLLLQEGFNQSYGALPYEKKLPHYFKQNLIAQTLNPLCYEKNPKFLRYKEESKLPFRPHEHFKKQDIEDRQILYQKICEKIYDLKLFDEIASTE